MGFDERRRALLLQLAAAGLWLCAGWLAAGADAGAGAAAAAPGAGARTWVAAATLALLALALTLLGLRLAPSPAPAPEPAPSIDNTLAERLQAQLEHLPVAVWVQHGERVDALSSRARRLTAPGGVREPQALRRWLAQQRDSGAVTLDTERGSERWMLRRQTLSVHGQAQTLLALVPLETELESASLQAWQQLVQVLTHEIMNSLTPIQSLSQTAQSLVGEPDGQAELQFALDAIARRAGHLSGFVSTYRRVTHWPAPTLAPVELAALLARLEQAVGPAWRARGGAVQFDTASSTLRVQADEGQLEQALLALLQNAADATARVPSPRLWVQARQGRGGRLQISVRDNGPGVPQGLERQIFLPFFSARDGGQGIGLTVVRQLVHGMGGRVRHVRPLEGGAAFVLSF